MHKLLLILGLLIFGLQWVKAGNECGILEEIEAVDDNVKVDIGDFSVINVLENDIGDGVKLLGVTREPYCNEVFEVLDDGRIMYGADIEDACRTDTLEYLIEDVLGSQATAKVAIEIIRPSDLQVITKKYCDVHTHSFALNVIIVGGTPPFTFEFNGGSYLINDFGEIGWWHWQNESSMGYYEFSLKDNTGQEFYEQGYIEGEDCGYCTPSSSEPQISCIGDNWVRIELNSASSQAYYILPDGQQKTLKQIDTIPNLSYLVVPYSSGIPPFDTLVNCLSANDDFFEVVSGKKLIFDVLKNDFGQKVTLSNILQMPDCGELLEWFPNGEITYQMDENENCQSGEILYEL